MATIHIPEAEAADKFAALMASVRAGAEVVIEKQLASGRSNKPAIHTTPHA